MRIIIIITVLGILSSCSVQKKAFKEIDIQEMVQLMREDAIALDVRTPEEVLAGYIAGTNIFINYNSPKFKDKVAKLDKQKTYIVYCRSGNRSTKAINIMLDLGFKNLYELDAGIKGVTNKELIVTN